MKKCSKSKIKNDDIVGHIPEKLAEVLYQPLADGIITFLSFKHSLSLFIRQVASLIYSIHHIRRLKLLTRLRVGLSHLREHKFYHNFHDTLCSCRSNSIESVEHFLLHCPNYSTYRCYLFDDLRQKEILILPFSCSYLVQILLLGNKFNFATNKEILSCIINFIINSKRFDGPLY